MDPRDVEAIEGFEKTGGPAYPAGWSVPSGGTISSPGMTLRDWLAGQALPAVIEVFDSHMPDAATRENFAMEAYRIADAMLTERSKP